METTRRWALGLGMTIVLAAGLSGCVTVEERDRLLMANRSLQAEKAQLEANLDDARSLADGMRTKVSAYEGSLSDKERLIGNLQEENESLDQQVAQARRIVEDTLAKIPLNKPLIMNQGLPPELDEALRAFSAENSQSVTYDQQRGMLKWSSDLLFVTGSDVAKTPAIESLRRFTEILNSSAGDPFEVMVVGHTDNRPIVRERTLEHHPTNWHLSAHRAIAVGKVMLEAGYDPQRISVVGCGEHRPLTENDTESNMAQNRRVDIYIVPRGTLVATGITTSREATK